MRWMGIGALILAWGSINAYGGAKLVEYDGPSEGQEAMADAPQSPTCPESVDKAARKANRLGHPVTQAPESVAGHVEACRAVLGEIPKSFDCSKGKELPVFAKDGERITRDKEGNYFKGGKPYERHSLDANSCAHPSLAPGFKSSACAIGSRLISEKVGGNTWVGFCRASWDLNEGVYGYVSMSVMGWNAKGETCQFDYQPGPGEFYTAIPGPGEPGGDKDKQKVDGWKAPSQFTGGNNCVSCHSTGSGPLIRTPYITNSGAEGLSAIPDGYRLIGYAKRMESYLEREPLQTVTPLVNGKPDKSCTECHDISTSSTSLIRSAVGLDGQKPWMPPGADKFSPEQLANAQEAVKRLIHCMSHPKDEKNCAPPGEVLSPCPPPDRLAADTARVESAENIDGDKLFSRNLSVSWKGYRDSMAQKTGNAQRDDVRFTIKVRGKEDGSYCVFENVKLGPKGDGNFTLPARAGVSYAVEIEPTRHCLDFKAAQVKAPPTVLSTRTTGHFSGSEAPPVWPKATDGSAPTHDK